MQYINIRRTMLVLTMLFVTLLMSGCKEADTVKENQISVNTAQAQIMDISKNVNYSGLVRGKNEVAIQAEVQARVTSVAVKPGDKVTAGQLLLTLDNDNFNAAVMQAQAGLEQAQAGLAANNMRVETARKQYERTKALHDAGAVSDLELETAENNLNLLTTGSAEAGVAMAEAALQQAQDRLDKCAIRSPISGVVGNINVSLGDYTNMYSTVATVTDNRELEIEILVSENEVSYIQNGGEVSVLVKAAQAEPLTGKVTSIATVADQNKLNYAVKISLQNPEQKIKSGMFAEVRLDTMSKKGVLCVPVSAVIPRSGQTVVYIVNEEGRAHEIEVTTGLSNSNYIEITAGLEAGQEVITSGNTLLNEGTLVRVVSGEGK